MSAEYQEAYKGSYITIAMVAKRLGRHPHTVREYMRSGLTLAQILQRKDTENCHYKLDSESLPPKN